MAIFKDGDRKREHLYKTFFPEKQKPTNWLVPVGFALALTAGEVYLLDLFNSEKNHLASVMRNPGRESHLEQKCRTTIALDPAEAKILLHGCKSAMRKQP